jgi:hypothetical protein
MRTSDVQFCITIVDRQLGLLSIIRRWEAPRVVLLCRYRQTSPWVSIAYLHIYIYMYIYGYIYIVRYVFCASTALDFEAIKISRALEFTPSIRCKCGFNVNMISIHISDG